MRLCADDFAVEVFAVEEVVGELPKTTSGKLQRSKTREQYLAGTLGTEGVRSLSTSAQRIALARHFATSMMSRIRHRLALLRLRGAELIHCRAHFLREALGGASAG